MNHNKNLIAAATTLLIITSGVVHSSDPGRVPVPPSRAFPTGNVIFFHPDGAGLNHWNAARVYFLRGADGLLNWDLLPNIAVYRGHMINMLIGTSNGGATTHAFGFKVDGYHSFGRDGDGNMVPPTVFSINSLSGFQGSIMRQAANSGLPVGVVNDGHIGEPGTGCFLAEVGNRNNWQEITRQIIQGRPSFPGDFRPWVIMGGGEADTLPNGSALLLRNHNQERGQPLNAATSLRSNSINLELGWDTQGGSPANPVITGTETAHIGTDNAIVIKTRVQFNALVNALNLDPNYAPRVWGIFAYQDLFNDRNEEDLINRGLVTTDPVNFVNPSVTSLPGLLLGLQSIKAIHGSSHQSPGSASGTRCS